MGRIMEPEECIAIRARGESEDPIVLAEEYGVSITTITNILGDLSYRRPECYAEGSPGRAVAVQRDKDYREEKKRQQRMRSGIRCRSYEQHGQDRASAICGRRHSPRCLPILNLGTTVTGFFRRYESW